MQAAGLKGSRLSSQQARLWSLQKKDRAYRVFCAVLIEGLMDVDTLQKIVQHMVERHEILRTLFYHLPGTDLPLQVISDGTTVSCPVISLEKLDTLHQLVKLDEIITSLQAEAFDLERGPLFHIWLLHLATDRHVLFVGLPALCADTSTLKLFVDELQRTYIAYLRDEPFPEEPLQYADVAAWQDELLLEEDAELQQQYWRKMELSQLANTRLPFDREHYVKGHGPQSDLEEAFMPQILEMPVGETLSTHIQAMAQRYGVLASTLLLACWQVLLWRLTEEPHFLIGVACDGRIYEELTNALGCYTRFVPVNADFEKDRSFEQVLTSVNLSLEAASKRQAYFTWEAVCDTTGDRPNFLPISFEYDVWPVAFAVERLTLSLYRRLSCIEPFALKLSVLQVGERLQLEVHYDPRRLASEQAGRLISMLPVLLHSVIAEPRALISTLTILPSTEQEYLLRTFRAPTTSRPPQVLHQLFEAQAECLSAQLAVISGSDQLTYHDLNSRANQLARVLRRWGVNSNVLVGLCVYRSVHMLVGLLAILKAGGAYVPLDPESPTARLAYQLQDTQASLLLTQQELLPRLPDWRGPILCLEALVQEMEHEPANNLPAYSEPGDLAYVIYTSGSTGWPKGVMIRQQSVVNYTLALCDMLEQQPGLHFATVSTLAADLGNTAIFCALASGGCLQVLDYELITSGEAFARWVAHHPIDVLKIVPSHLSALLSSEQAQALLPRRALILGGEALPASLLARLRELGGNCKLYNHYGPTETTVGVLVNILGPLNTLGEDKESLAAYTIVPLGRPIANSETYVLDRQQQMVPTGVMGELYLGGAGLAVGYLHLPEQTAERFVPHPFARQAGARLYRTGDLASYTASGQIEFIGRRDNQVKLRGYRIELGEIEAVLSQHPNVRDCAVVLQEDVPGENRLVSYVVARRQPRPTSEELRTFVREYVPAYMVPSLCLFLESFPLTLNGKVDRQRLPKPEQNNVRSISEAPRSPVEAILLDIWKNLLGIAVIGIHDNFFQLGGHSLLATQVISQVRAVLRVELSILSLFEAPTIAGLAQQVELALHGGQVSEEPSLLPVERTQNIPLSFAQQRLWFLDQLEPGSTAYLSPRAQRLRGNLDSRALERSLEEVVRRHESLRTTFQMREGQPVQVIHPAHSFCLPLIDLGELTTSQHEVVVSQLAQHEAQQPCDLIRGPLFRTWLIRLARREHVLLVTLHHIISDGWSTDILVRELTTLYHAFVHGQPCPLPPLPIQYADFAYWQQQWIHSELLTEQISYWTRRLQNLAPLNLPTDHPYPAIQSFRGAHQALLLPDKLHDALRSLSQREGVTLFMTLVTAFQILLARYSGQVDIAVGTPIANRTRQEIEGLIGFFVNTLVLRCDLSGNPSVLELLARVRDVSLGAYSHQDLPFEQLVEVLHPQRDLHRSPLFQVMFILQNGPQPPEEFVDVTLSPLEMPSTTAKFDLTLEVQPTAQGLLCRVEYRTDLFEPASILRLLGHWQCILESFVADPTRQLANLPLLTQSEQYQLLHNWNDTFVPLPAEMALHQLIEAQVRRTPDSIAVCCDEHSLTYRQLNTGANRLAQALREEGIGPECVVAVLAERSLPWLTALLAIWKAQGVYLSLDPLHPVSRLQHIVMQSQARVLLTTTAFLPLLSQILVGSTVTPPGKVLMLAEHVTGDLPDVPSQALPTQLAYVIYTSGSTGVPKGVMVEQQGMLNHLLAKMDAVGLNAADRVAQNGPQGFDVSVWQSLAALVCGGSVQLIRDELAFNPTHLLAQVQERAITILQLVPSLLRAILAEPGRVGEHPPPLDALRWVLPTGEALPTELCKQWFIHYPHIPMLNTYGSTECSDDQCHYVLDRVPSQEAELASVSLGFPIANMRVYVLDQALNLVPLGVVGDLYLAGVGVGRGYLGDPIRTALAFVPDPFSEHAGGRLYMTRDVVRYLPTGALEFLGRSDQVVKVRGYRIELGEVEAALAQQNEVQQSVVVARETEGGQDTELVAYVVVREPGGLVEEELRRHLRGKLPDYMLPSWIVQLEALPLNANGKVDRRALPAPRRSEGAVVSRPERESRSGIEEVVATIWRTVLGREPTSVHDNFFAQGGHSLLATKLIARLRASIGIELPLRSLFEAPTIAGLAQRVEQALLGAPSVEAPPLVPVVRTQDLPLSFAQQRLWFLDQLEPENIAYLIPGTQRLHGILDTVALQRSLEEVLRRHESLRTTFQMRADQPVQVIQPVERFYLPLIDLQGLTEEERVDVARRVAGQEKQRACNLERGPLLRVSLLRLNRQEHVVLLTMHHIISDAWSNDIFYWELTELYKAFTAGKPSPLPPLPIQYADFAVWQRQWLQGEVLEAQLVYWKRQLMDVPPLELPIDHPRLPRQTFRGEYQSIPLPLSLREGLLRLSQQEDVTLFMLLLAAFQVLLARYTGQRDISVGTAIANRSRPELEGLIGFFANTLVLRTDLSGNPSFVEVLKRVREVALGAYTHQDVPFEYLVEVLHPQRDLSRSPLFQVSFAVHQVLSVPEGPQGLTSSWLGTEQTTTKFELSMALTETPHSFQCGVIYNRDLFAAETIQSLLVHWQCLLEGLLAAPQRSVSDLPLLSAAERQRVLVDWNATHRSFAPPTSLTSLLAAQAARTPDALALVTADGSLSYGALTRLAHRLAHCLLARGLRPHTAVALYMERGLPAAISLLGVLYARGIYLPLDLGAPRQRLALLLTESQASLLLTQYTLRERVPTSLVPLLLFEDLWPQLCQSHAQLLDLPPTMEQEAAYLLATSGSTGRPKGVLVPQSAIVNRLCWGIAAVDLQATDRLGQLASWSFDIALWELLGPWLVGASSVVLSEEQVKDSRALLQRVRQEQLTVLHVVPSLLSVVAQEPSLATCQTLRCVQCGGEALRPEVLQQVWRQLAVEVQHYYGPSEAAISVTSWTGRPEEGVEQFSLGHPIANTQLYIVDEAWQPVVPGVWGEIWLGGAGLAWGYVQQAGLTAERFVPDEWSGGWGKRLYRTGDVGRQQADGSVVYGGRRDRQIKLRGHRIELAEIEAALAQQEGVSQSVVQVEAVAGGEPRLVGYVESVAEGGVAWQERMRAGLEERLPSFMLPARLVRLRQLPRLSSGKVDYGRLAEREQEESQEEGQEQTAPRTPLEELLGQLWQEVLVGGPVGIHTDFFAAGGHSLLATRLMARVRRVLQVEVGVQTLFEAPTIAELARQVEQQWRGGQEMEEVPLIAQARGAEAALSFAQQRLWFLDQLEPGSTAYLIPGAQQLHGPLDVMALEGSLRALRERHESLRTTFELRAEQPVQVIHPLGQFHLPLIDLRGRLTHEERLSEAQLLARKERQHPCDLVQGPLLRVSLLRLDVEEHILLITMHHIISDGWSIQVLVRELRTLYREFAAGRPSPLLPLPIQYADFALWQRQLLQGEILKTQLTYWLRQLAGAPLLELPTDHSRPPAQTYRGAQQSIQLSLSLREELIALSRQEGVTLFMLLLAAFQVLLARYSGQHDISVGTPIANRTRSELEGLIGFFVNTLVLRTNLSGNPSFVEVLRRVREVTLGAYAHQDVPFEHLVEALQPQRDLSRSPLFQVMFGVQQVSEAAEGLEGLTSSVLSTKQTTAQFDLTFTAVCSPHSFSSGVVYSTDLFEANTIQLLLEHWQTLLADLAKNPHTPLSNLQLLTETERRRLLVEWNETTNKHIPQKCLHTLFVQQVTRTPEAVALSSEETCLTYGQLNRKANQLAHYLQTLGVAPEVLVGVVTGRSTTTLICLLAVLKAGGGYVPLDPGYPQARLHSMLADAQVSIMLIAHEAEREVMSGGQAQIVCLEHMWQQLAQQSADEPPGQVQIDNVAYVIFTSGSTGKPKGVLVTHRGLGNLALAQADAFGVGATSRVLQFASLSFDASIAEIAVALLTGACLSLSSQERLLPGADLLSLLREQAITVLTLPPSALAVLPVEALPTLATLIVAGEACPVELMKRWAIGRRFCNAYGPTETTVCASISQWVDEPGQQWSSNIGRPLTQTQLYVLDEQLHPVPQGVAGDLYIAGIGLARGYLKGASETAECFLPHPFSMQEGTRLYKTGDRVRYRENGTLAFLGRRDQQVKVRGYRIELAEIEAVLSQHPAVRQCVVLQQDALKDPRLVAYVVSNQLDRSLMGNQLRVYLQEQLPDYMVPWRVVALETLPLLPNGKVDQRALLSPETYHVEPESIIEELRTPIEELLVQIWCEVLDDDQISIQDNFFDLGGHSLLATQIIARVQSALQVQVPLQSLFESPTIVGLARHVEQALRGWQKSIEAPSLVPVSRKQKLPLSFAQQRLWFLDRLEPESIAYLISGAQLLYGTLDVAALEHSIAELVRRHESLRTTFQLDEDQPVQFIHQSEVFWVPFVDLQGLEQDERMHETQCLARQETQRACDLIQGPLLRTYLLRLARHEHVFLLTLHHIISDGWSNDVFGRELVALYRAYAAGKPSPLPPLPIQYADFAVWQRQWLQGDVLEAQLSYWRRQLAEVPVLQLPTDYPRPPVQTFHGKYQSISLPLPLCEELIVLSQQQYVTLFMLLLAAFQVLLARYSGQTDISVGTPIANRPRSELEGLIGFFVNTLVLRTDLSGNPSFVEVLKRVREVALNAYAHQDVPFEHLVEVLKPQRDLSRSPLFQVAFTVQQAPAVTEQLEGLTFSGLSTEHTTTKFDLSFNVLCTVQGWHCGVEYNTDLFEAETISRLLAHWQALLDDIAAYPAQRISDVALLSLAERQQLLVDWNATQRTLPNMQCLHILVEQQERCRPDAVALVCEEQCLSYGALNRYADQLATHLLKMGLLPHTPVALCVERSALGAIALLGLLKAGGVYLPLDATAPSQRLAGLLEETQASLLLTQQHLRARLPQTSATILALEQEWPQLLCQPVQQRKALEQSVQQAAYVMYTSGSTGQPKGVLVPHAAIVNRLWWGISDVELQASDRLAQLASWSFDIALWELFGPWLVGASSVVLSEEQVKDSGWLLKRVREEQITVLHAVPSLLSVLVAEPSFERCRSVRCLLSGGEVVRPELVQQVFASLEVPVHQYYGPTEAAISVTSWTGRPEEGVAQLSLGRPIANTRLYVVDEAWQPVVPGVHGEIWIGGTGLAWGYMQRAEQTAERFVPDAWSGVWGGRLYRTGDVGHHRPDGTLAYVGRRDQQVKLRGYRIELGEIEAALLEQEGVTESVVLLQEDRRGEQQLVAYLVGNVADRPSSEQVRRGLQERLPNYMLPTSLVWLEALPLLATGKVDRRCLTVTERQMQEEYDQEGTARTPLEELLGEIWAAVLGGARPGIHDDFFALGGHSLLATQIVSRVRAVMQVEMPLRSLFEAPTIAGLAQRVEQALPYKLDRERPPLVPAPRTHDLPLSFAQQRLWFLDQLQPGSTAYLVPSAQQLHGALHAVALERSLTELVRRHESLRTTFQARTDQPLQVIHSAGQFHIPLIDLRGLTLKGHEVQRLAKQEAERPFDLAQGPLLRVWLLRLDVEEHVLLLTMHHIISDGWSLQVLVRELATLYRSFVFEQPSPLPPLPIQYADFALWQRQWLQDEVLQKYLDYWKKQLMGATPIDLPTDYSRPRIQSYRGAGYSFALSADLSERLTLLSRREGVTLFMLLLAAFQTLLYRYTGQMDVVIGTDMANRLHVETESLIGFFINLLALRTDLSGAPPFRSVLRRVREIVLGAYAHQDIPFEMLVEHLRLERQANRTPLINVLFVLQNIPKTSQNLPGIVFEPVEKGITTAKFDLALFMHEDLHGIGGAVVYSTDLFEEGTIATMMSRFEVLLHHVADRPDTSIDVLDIYTDAEKAKQVKHDADLHMQGGKDLRTIKGEEIDLPELKTWQMRQKKR